MAIVEGQTGADAQQQHHRKQVAHVVGVDRRQGEQDQSGSHQHQPGEQRGPRPDPHVQARRDEQ
jgi:hypothetical protein